MSIVEKAIQKVHERLARGRGAAETVVDFVVAPEVVPSHQPLDIQRPRLLLDREAMRAHGLLGPAEEEQVLARAFRRIKRPLVARALTEPANAIPSAGVIMMASAMSGDGKTFTAVNLALSLALEKDSSVLLIDADVAKPQITAVLGLQHHPGLLDAVADPSLDVEALIHETDVQGLCVLGAGEQQQFATELLASQNMAALIRRLREADPRRIVLLDSPPLLLTTESRELGSVAGQVVIVVRAGQTPRAAVYDAVEMFPEERFVGLVLNQASLASVDGSYYGYGGYGYGTGAAGTASGGTATRDSARPT